MARLINTGDDDIEGDGVPRRSVSSSRSSTSSPPDELVATAETPLLRTLPPEDPRALYRQLRSEARDPVWAPRAESSVKAALANIPYVDRAGGPTIRCAASLCEVHGTFAQASDDNTNVAMQQLQGDVLRRRLGAAGLDQGLAAFTGGNKQSGFTLYLRRQ